MSRILIFPTDTVYGMGVSINDKEGQDRIYQIKGRPSNKRLSVLCANIEDIESKYYFDMSNIPLDLPWGYYLEIYWDGQLVETFTIPTLQQ